MFLRASEMHFKVKFSSSNIIIAFRNILLNVAHEYYNENETHDVLNIMFLSHLDYSKGTFDELRTR